MHHRPCVVMQHHLNVGGAHIAKVHCPSLRVPFSSASGKRVGLRDETRLGPIFNSANDAVEQALSKPALGELVRGGG